MANALTGVFIAAQRAQYMRDSIIDTSYDFENGFITITLDGDYLAEYDFRAFLSNISHKESYTPDNNPEELLKKALGHTCRFIDDEELKRGDGAYAEDGEDDGYRHVGGVNTILHNASEWAFTHFDARMSYDKLILASEKFQEALEHAQMNNKEGVLIDVIMEKQAINQFDTTSQHDAPMMHKILTEMIERDPLKPEGFSHLCEIAAIVNRGDDWYVLPPAINTREIYDKLSNHANNLEENVHEQSETENEIARALSNLDFGESIYKNPAILYNKPTLYNKPLESKNFILAANRFLSYAREGRMVNGVFVKEQ